MKNCFGLDPAQHRHCEPCFLGRGNLTFLNNEIASPQFLLSQENTGARNDSKGFTLIELVMIILITSLLSVAGLHIMQFTVRNTFYLPNQVEADLVAAEALEILVEGDSQAKGLRFSKEVTTAGANQVVVTNQDDETITYSLSGGSLFREIAPDAAVMIPYFKAADMTLSGVGGSLFTYYDSAEAVTTVPADVRRIDINLMAQQGTGSSDKYEGFSQQSTSVKVNKYL